MIKMIKEVFFKYKVWFLTICILNAIYMLMIWLVNSSAFLRLVLAMILGSLILYCGVGFYLFKEYIKRVNTINSLFDFSDNIEEIDMDCFCEEDKKLFNNTRQLLIERNNLIRHQQKDMDEYSKYIEAWAHEIKTPLGLMTFILDNRKDEMSKVAYERLEYTRISMEEDIQRMLYYSRLKSCYSDYLLTSLSLKDMCFELIEEYKISLKEHRIRVCVEVEDVDVFSDKKGLMFMLRQVISNAIKYKQEEAEDSFIMFKIKRDDKIVKLSIEDNGIGVKAFDLPFIFDKGFTGEIGEERKNATGMGLYLLKQIADDLKISLEVSSEYKKMFKISFIFNNI